MSLWCPKCGQTYDTTGHFCGGAQTIRTDFSDGVIERLERRIAELERRVEELARQVDHQQARTRVYRVTAREGKGDE